MFLLFLSAVWIWEICLEFPVIFKLLWNRGTYTKIPPRLFLCDHCQNLAIQETQYNFSFPNKYKKLKFSEVFFLFFLFFPEVFELSTL